MFRILVVISLRETTSGNDECRSFFSFSAVLTPNVFTQCATRPEKATCTRTVSKAFLSRAMDICWRCADTLGHAPRTRSTTDRLCQAALIITPAVAITARGDIAVAAKRTMACRGGRPPNRFLSVPLLAGKQCRSAYSCWNRGRATRKFTTCVSTLLASKPWHDSR